MYACTHVLPIPRPWNRVFDNSPVLMYDTFTRDKLWHLRAVTDKWYVFWLPCYRSVLKSELLDHPITQITNTGIVGLLRYGFPSSKTKCGLQEEVLITQFIKMKQIIFQNLLFPSANYVSCSDRKAYLKNYRKGWIIFVSLFITILSRTNFVN